MAERLQLRRDTAAQWEAVNPILRLCEIGLVVDIAGRVTGMKIGDGRVWNALPLIPISEKVVSGMIADGAVTAEKIAEGVIPTKLSQLVDDIGATGSGNAVEVPRYFPSCALDISTNSLYDVEDAFRSDAVVVGIADLYDNDKRVGLAVATSDISGIVVYTTDYTYAFSYSASKDRWDIDEKIPTPSDRYATKDEVATAIQSAITNTLNTEV